MSAFWKVVSNAGKTKTGQKIISALTGGKQKTTGKEVITSFKPAKNLASRRKEQDELVTLIDRQYTKVGVKPGKSASKIKKEAISKSSKIHDKWEKWGWKQSNKDLGKK